MKGINKYIIEKLHLNKDIKTSDDSENAIIKLIYDITLFDEDEITDELNNALKKWISDYNVTSVDVYMLWTINTHKHLKDINKDIKIHTLQINNYVEMLEKYLGSDKTREKLLIYYDDYNSIEVYASNRALNIVTRGSDFILKRN